MEQEVKITKKEIQLIKAFCLYRRKYVEDVEDMISEVTMEYYKRKSQAVKKGVKITGSWTPFVIKRAITDYLRKYGPITRGDKFRLGHFDMHHSLEDLAEKTENFQYMSPIEHSMFMQVVDRISLYNNTELEVILKRIIFKVLDAQNRHILSEVFWHKRLQKEIAEGLGLSENAITQRLNRIYFLLREYMEKNDIKNSLKKIA